MSNYFEAISENEYRSLLESISLVTILIAGADGTVDAEEKEWAVKVANIRTYSGPEILREFYKDVGPTFEEKLDNLIKALPDNTEKRNAVISERLSKLNPILNKLEQSIGATFYENLTSMALHIAKASGGFMRMWSISKAEAKWVKLPMIDPIDFPEPEEEIE